MAKKNNHKDKLIAGIIDENTIKYLEDFISSVDICSDQELEMVRYMQDECVLYFFERIVRTMLHVRTTYVKLIKELRTLEKRFAKDYKILEDKIDFYTKRKNRHIRVDPVSRTPSLDWKITYNFTSSNHS